MTGVFNLGKVLTEEECRYLRTEMIQADRAGIFRQEPNVSLYGMNAFSAPFLPNKDELFEKFTPIVENLIGKKVNPNTIYTRIYQNGSVLNPHTDRARLDWTISICIFSDVGFDWTLDVETYNDDIVNLPTIDGYASLINGRKLNHWREQLYCNEFSRVIQTFLHFTEIQ